MVLLHDPRRDGPGRLHLFGAQALQQRSRMELPQRQCMQRPRQRSLADHQRRQRRGRHNDENHAGAQVECARRRQQGQQRPPARSGERDRADAHGLGEMRLAPRVAQHRAIAREEAGTPAPDQQGDGWVRMPVVTECFARKQAQPPPPRPQPGRQLELLGTMQIAVHEISGLPHGQRPIQGRSADRERRTRRAPSAPLAFLVFEALRHLDLLAADRRQACIGRELGHCRRHETGQQLHVGVDRQDEVTVRELKAELRSRSASAVARLRHLRDPDRQALGDLYRAVRGQRVRQDHLCLEPAHRIQRRAQAAVDVSLLVVGLDHDRDHRGLDRHRLAEPAGAPGRVQDHAAHGAAELSDLPHNKSLIREDVIAVRRFFTFKKFRI